MFNNIVYTPSRPLADRLPDIALIPPKYWTQLQKEKILKKLKQRLQSEQKTHTVQPSVAHPPLARTDPQLCPPEDQLTVPSVSSEKEPTSLFGKSTLPQKKCSPTTKAEFTLANEVESNCPAESEFSLVGKDVTDVGSHFTYSTRDGVNLFENGELNRWENYNLNLRTSEEARLNLPEQDDPYPLEKVFDSWLEKPALSQSEVENEIDAEKAKLNSAYLPMLDPFAMRFESRNLRKDIRFGPSVKLARNSPTGEFLSTIWQTGPELCHCPGSRVFGNHFRGRHPQCPFVTGFQPAHVAPSEPTPADRRCQYGIANQCSNEDVSVALRGGGKSRSKKKSDKETEKKSTSSPAPEARPYTQPREDKPAPSEKQPPSGPTTCTQPQEYKAIPFKQQLLLSSLAACRPPQEDKPVPSEKQSLSGHATFTRPQKDESVQSKKDSPFRYGIWTQRQEEELVLSEIRKVIPPQKVRCEGHPAGFVDPLEGHIFSCLDPEISSAACANKKKVVAEISEYLAYGIRKTFPEHDIGPQDVKVTFRWDHRFAEKSFTVLVTVEPYVHQNAGGNRVLVKAADPYVHQYAGGNRIGRDWEIEDIRILAEKLAWRALVDDLEEGNL